MIAVDLKERRLGAVWTQEEARVRLWAPFAKKTELYLLKEGEKLPMQQDQYGYWQIRTDQLKPGDPYKFVLDGERELPDPASLAQPEGPHRYSQLLNLKGYRWQERDWKNLPLEDYMLYELHVGTFSPEGTFEGIIQKLDYLKELGITAIELMPVAQFPGERNWGYDGTYPFAVQNSYGGAAGLQQLVEACHARGLAVVLDVVYNHLGPEGNYLEAYGPYFTDKYHTPWGKALNFDDAWSFGVRNYFIENALMWFRDFHIDALRLDAVHAIKDFSPTHFLRELKQRVNELSEVTGRPYYLIAEVDLNDTRFIRPLEQEGFGMDAQWIDEFHHALRVTAGQEKSGYYADFEGLSHLTKAYRDAYVYTGQYSPHRHNFFGSDTSAHPGSQFVVFSQNHDQVGNRMLGERSSQLFSTEMLKLLAGAVIFSPYLPMLFMGEEWAETNPFLYFISHTDPDLVKAVQKGRKAEFKAFHAQGEAPDPQAEKTFNQSKLQWELPEKSQHSHMLRWYQTLIRLRKSLPALKNLNRHQLKVKCSEAKKAISLYRWHEGQHVLIVMNFSDKPQNCQLPTYREHWYRQLDSAAPEWGGPQEAPDTLEAGATLHLQPESIVLYTHNRHV